MCCICVNISSVGVVATECTSGIWQLTASGGDKSIDISKSGAWEGSSYLCVKVGERTAKGGDEDVVCGGNKTLMSIKLTTEGGAEVNRVFITT